MMTGRMILGVSIVGVAVCLVLLISTIWVFKAQRKKLLEKIESEEI